MALNAYEQVEAIESVLFDLIDPNNDDALDAIREKLDAGWGLLDIFQVVNDYKAGTLGAASALTLVGGINSTVTALVASASTHPPVPFDIAIDDERMTVTAATGTAWTVTRHVGGTSAASHSNGATILVLASGAVTSVKVTGGSALTGDVVVPNAQTVAGGGLPGLVTSTEKDKLAGIAAGATANSSDATLLARANHTGTQSADTLVDGSTNKAFLATERTKLAGIATGATANSSDAYLLNLGNSTGTLDANKIVDNAGTGATDGRKYTKADKDLVARIPASGTILVQANLDTHKDATTGAEHQAEAIATTAHDMTDDNIFGVYVNDDVATLGTWANDTPISTALNSLADAFGLAEILFEIHKNQTTSVHSIADTTKLVARDSSGKIRIPTTSTPPAAGANPPANSIDIWGDQTDQSLHFRNTNGEETVVVPGWRNEYDYMTGDTSVANATLVDLLATDNNLVALAEYIVFWELYYTATTAGGGRCGVVVPTGASFDWSGIGIETTNADTSAPVEGLMMIRKGTASTQMTFGGAGTGVTLPFKGSGRLKLASTADVFKIQGAEMNVNATATVFKANSWMKLERVA